jgi:hypothetical protein
MNLEVPAVPLPVLRSVEAVRLLGQADAEAEAKAWPNKRVQATGNSLRSSLASAAPRA